MMQRCDLKSHDKGPVQSLSAPLSPLSVNQGRRWTFTLSDILKYSSNPCVVMVGHVQDEQINNGRLRDLNSTLFSACQNHLLFPQREQLSLLSRCFSVVDFFLFQRNPRSLFGWCLWVRVKFTPCLVLLCPVLWIHISAAPLNSIDQKGTHWQTHNELRSKGIGCAFSLFNNHRHRDREVKQSSNCQPRQWSEKSGGERGK